MKRLSFKKKYVDLFIIFYIPRDCIPASTLLPELTSASFVKEWMSDQLPRMNISSYWVYIDKPIMGTDF